MSSNLKINKRELLEVYRQALLKNVALADLDQKVLDLTKRNLANQGFEQQLDQKITKHIFGKEFLILSKWGRQ
jgi:hypothetical protein